jgi:ATP-dependent DNA helicase RecG
VIHRKKLEQAITFIRKNLMVEYIITGEPQRLERYDYPLEAIREAGREQAPCSPMHPNSSRSRNRAIAKIFKETGMIERYGSGIKRIKNIERWLKQLKKEKKVEFRGSS